MAATKYTLDFGAANAGAGSSLTFDYFVRFDTDAAVTPPAILEEAFGNGSYYFLWDWASSPAQSIAFQITYHGIEQSDVISGTQGPGASSATVAPSSLVGYDTAANIINRTAIQVGIVSGTLSTLPDPFAQATTDGNFARLIELLNTLGDDLNNEHDWSQFTRECTIVTVGGALSYALPADFHEMKDQTGWNRSMRLPMVGPVSPQEAQFLKARMGNMILNIAFRLEGSLMVFPLAPPDAQTIVFEYVSNFWVQTATSSTGPDAARVNNASDVVLYDPDLCVAGLRLAFNEVGGFDTAKDQERFDAKLEHCIGKNMGAPTLRLAGARGPVGGLISVGNLPPTGWAGP